MYLKIAGLYYNVEQKTNADMNGRVGLADFNKQEILINKEHTKQTRKIAVYHEIIHILSDVYGLNLTEQQVQIGTHALIAFLSDNPQFKAEHCYETI